MTMRGVPREFGVDFSKEMSLPQQEHKEYKEEGAMASLRELRDVVCRWTDWCLTVGKNDAAWNADGELVELFDRQFDAFLKEAESVALLDLKKFKAMISKDDAMGQRVRHDVQNKAVAILGYMQMCRSRNSLRDTLSSVGNAMPQYFFILEDVLLRSVDEERVASSYESWPVPPALLDHAIEQFAVSAGNQFKTGEVRLSGRVQDAIGLHEELVSVPGVSMNTLFNCVRNAMKPQIDASVIDIDISRQNNMLSIKVMDNGIGMEQRMIDPADHEHYIFGKTSGTNSTGLGLHHADTRLKSLGAYFSVATRPRGADAFSVFSTENSSPEVSTPEFLEGRFSRLKEHRDVNTIFEIALPIQSILH